MKKVMVFVLFSSAVAGWSSFSNAEDTMTFHGDKYTAKITSHCAEGNLSCDNVTFDSKSNKTGKGIILKGNTVNVNCPEVCDFAGYEFNNGAYKYYFVSGNNNIWDLDILKNGKVISSDKGRME
ncbi:MULTISPECIES: hypothetical protein [unclassified Erwinia]|uniref:hypothetical protein n=1 Tax=unclassified Erwinia TaxID=2622719 RepID=UPI00263AEDC1|nr:hypothetical protein [Erwinia sp. PsM31]MDN4629548.1 hypothetical protein [Erwinia sp. PsM31]